MVIVARGHLQIHGKHNTISKTVYIYKLEGQYHTTGKEAAANAAAEQQQQRKVVEKKTMVTERNKKTKTT